MSNKYIPFPIDLTKYKSVEELTPLQFGILMRFIQRFWKTGIELPKIEFQLYHIARCPFKQWAQAKDSVYKAMDEVFLPIKEARNQIMSNKQKFRDNALKGQSVLRIKRIKKLTTFSDENETHVKINAIMPPLEKTRYHQGQHDHVARSKALEAKKDGKEVWLKDS